MRPIRLFLLTVLASAAPAAAGVAQDKPLPILRGTVHDSAGRPLEGAQLQILGVNLTATTPGSGTFRFEEIKPGKYWVVVRRIGFAPLRTTLSFNRGDDRQINFELRPLPYNLPDVKVRAEDKAWMRKYQDFAWRAKGTYRGGFITRDEIERFRPAYLGDVVRRYLPWTNPQAFFEPYYPELTGLSTISRRVELSGLSFRRNCSPAVSVNGGLVSSGWAVNDFRPEQVEAVEVYRGGQVLPLEFSDRQAYCGLVIIWLR